nr:EstWSD [uncultured bacterium]
MGFTARVAKTRSSPAVRFLWVVAGLTVLFMAGALAYRIFEADLMRWAMVPKVDFAEVPMPEGASYADADLWVARPDMRRSPASWTPPGFAPGRPRAAVFFVHPTSFLESSAWNAPIDDAESRERADLFVRAQASAFNHVGAVWAPRYRQAAFGAFLTNRDDARRALDFAYRDVLAAYEAFLEQTPAGAPIILAGHSQGALHLLRLLQERVAGAPEAGRIAAAYVVGWPVSETADLPALPLPACERADQAGCLLSWQSFGEPADPAQVTDHYDASQGPGGVTRAGSPMLCVNPLTGTKGGEAPAAANLGTLIPNEGFTEAEFRRGAVPARCDLRGLLLIGDADALPEMGPYVLPGNNYHVYDYSLFWANVRADAARRLAAFLER